MFVLERVKSNYNNLLKNPPVLEGLVKMVVLSPLLDLAGFYQAPFRIKLENEVQISSLDEDEQTLVNGKIDILVLKQTFWIFVIEAKMSDFSLTKALPQALSYMLGSPNHKVFGILTNGTDFVFLKLLKATFPQYATSQVFSLLSPGNELIQVLQILKKIRQIIAIES